MKRSDIQPIPVYFDQDINLVEDVSLKDAFEKSIAELKDADKNEWEQSDKVYTPSKWTI